MKILVVVPKYNLSLKPNYNYHFPLGLAYIFSILKRAGHDMECLNMNHIEGTPANILISRLNEKTYDIVCVGGMAMDYAFIEIILQTVKSHESKPITILGGLIINSDPLLIYNALKPTYGVVGEGEETIVELVDAIIEKKDVDHVKGIIFSKNHKTIMTPNREVVADLDSIPFPDFEAFDFETKLNNSYNNDIVNATFNDSEPRLYPIMTSRDCPFQCTFCYHIGRYRSRSISNVMKEIRFAVKKYRISSLLIYDDCFSSNQKRLFEFCAEIKKLRSELSWELSWKCSLIVTTVDENMLAIMKDAGCCDVSYGFESYSPIVLKSMRKAITPQLIDNAIKITFKQKMSVSGNFIFGDVAETVETSNETLNYWEKNCAGQVFLALIQPYPGSQIYKHCVEKGIIKNRIKFIKNDLRTFEGNMTNNMTEKEYSNLKKKIIRLSEKHFSGVIPLRLKRRNKKYYSLTVRCPYCKKHTTYNYCQITNRFYYGFAGICRHCYKHYWVASLSQYIVLKRLQFMIPYYLKLSKFFKVILLRKKIDI